LAAKLQDRQACSVDEGDDAALSRRNNQTRKIGGASRLEVARTASS
jgi:hypothetical protein